MGALARAKFRRWLAGGLGCDGYCRSRAPQGFRRGLDPLAVRALGRRAAATLSALLLCCVESCECRETKAFHSPCAIQHTQEQQCSAQVTCI